MAIVRDVSERSPGITYQELPILCNRDGSPYWDGSQYQTGMNQDSNHFGSTERVWASQPPKNASPDEAQCSRPTMKQNALSPCMHGGRVIFLHGR